MDPLTVILTWVTTNPTAIPFAGLVTFAIIGLFRGWLVPGPVVRDRIADKDSQIANLSQERDDWKATARASEDARHELVQQNKDLIDAGETTNRLLEAMRALFERQQGHGDGPTGLPPAQPRKEIEP